MISTRAILALLATLAMCLSPATAASPARSTITDIAQFDKLARTIPIGRYARFPQVMFVIDRAAKGGPRVHYVDTRRYQFHIDYIRAQTLSVQSEAQLLDASYSKADRRFILGSVVRYPALDRYGVEFWEGDVLDTGLIATTMTLLGASFPKPLAFKPNSQGQIDLAHGISGLAILDAATVYGSGSARVLNAGHAVGRLRILPRLTPETVIARGDIVVLQEVPLQMSPVAGLITSQFSTPLAHVNLLAKSWRIPNVYIADAATRHAALDGRMVTLDAHGDTIELRAATTSEIARAGATVQRNAVRLARADLSYRAFPALTEQHATDVIRTGAKAANLGEVAHGLARRGGDFSVPPGFSIPFAYYADFVRRTRLDSRIDALLADRAALDDPARLRIDLAALRTAFVDASFDPALLRAVSARKAAVIGDGGVFARSSTNSEDLKGFNGAGLYTSVPNVVGDAALATAIKTVWASVWNDTAFAARVAAGIDHRSVMASVLVQRGMNAESSGVMITENPFDPSEKGAIFINAKRGLGIRVVEGRRVAEQLLYRADPESVQVLTRSNDDAMLVFDTNGGVREAPSEPGSAVLTDAFARRLARVGSQIATYFGGRAQDIEWLTIGDTLFVVQSRPYLRGN